MRPGGGGRAAGPGIASPPGPRQGPDPDGPGPRRSQPAVASHPSLAQPKLLPLASGTPRIRVGIPGSEPARLPRRLPACELPTSEPRARLRRKPSTCRVRLTLMTPAEGEGRPAQAGREGRWTRASKRSHLSRQRPGSGGRGGCEVQPEPEPGAGWQGRSGVCEGAQGEGVSLGRAPSGARLEQRLPELRRPAPSQRAPRPVPGSLAARIPNGSRPNYSPAVQDSERPQILPEEKGNGGGERTLQSPTPCELASPTNQITQLP